MSGSTFARGAQSMNSMFFKPSIRKAYHKKSTTPDSLRETMKQEAEEMNKGKCRVGDGDGSSWVPHEQTGIYYPKGQEKVMHDIPPVAAKDLGVNWFSRSH